MSLKVGLTGNIGSGKSTISRIFENLGIPVFYADEESKSLFKSEEIIKKIINEFGAVVLNEEQEIDRKKLAFFAFSDKNKLQTLNKILHPEVYKLFLNWAFHKNKHPYLIMEAAILFESGFNEYVDYTINVHADFELRLSRVLLRDKSNKKDVLARMNNQISDEEKKEMADITILNNENQLVIPQVLNIHEALIKKGSN